MKSHHGTHSDDGHRSSHPPHPDSESAHHSGNFYHEVKEAVSEAWHDAQHLGGQIYNFFKPEFDRVIDHLAEKHGSGFDAFEKSHGLVERFSDAISHQREEQAHQQHQQHGEHKPDQHHHTSNDAHHHSNHDNHSHSHDHAAHSMHDTHFNY